MADTADRQDVSATVVAWTDVGRMREHNEDHFLVLDSRDGRRMGTGERLDVDLSSAVVMAVADGMGGAAAGEVASRMASERLATNLGDADYTEATPDQITALLDRAIHEANDEIHSEAKDNQERRGMGTTLTAAIALPGRIYISQVGDSRGYLIRKGKLVQLTRDQSLVGQLIEEGTLTEEEAEKLGARNIVLQAVGVEESLRVDTRHWEVLRGDVLILCSDGLSGMIRDDQIQDIVNTHVDDARRAVELLVEAANEAGGRDNITVVMARFEGEGLRAPLESTASSVEKAGASFKAPPPPEVPNPMKKVGAALAAIIAVILLLFFFLQRTTADVSVTWTPASIAAELSLVPVSGGDGRKLSAEAGSARFTKVDPGEYRVAAAAAGYFEEAKTIRIQEAGDVNVALRLVPKPGNVEIRSGTAYVTIQIEAPGLEGAEPFNDSFLWPDPTEAKQYEQIPSGSVHVRVSREGFRSWEQEQTLAAEGLLEFVVPPLTEIEGGLTIVCTEAGFEVTLVDDRGELLESLTTTGGRQELEMRVGTHELRASKAGYASYTRNVEVTENEAPLIVEIPTALRPVAVTFVGEAGKAVGLEEWSGGEWTPLGRPIFLRNTGRSRPKDLTPGKYRATWNGRQKEFEVVAGQDAVSVELE